MNAQAFAQVENGRAVFTNGAADDNLIARFNTMHTPIDALRNDTNAAGVNEDFIHRAFLYHFGVARHHLHTGSLARFCHGLNNVFEFG